MDQVNEYDYEFSPEALLSVDIPPMAAARMHRLPPYLFGRINALKHSLRQNGVDIIDLGMGNPTDPTPDLIVEKLREAVGDKRNQRYSASQGIYNLRRELAVFYQKQWGVELDPASEAIATIGTKEGFSHLCLATLGPGDVALTLTPAFPIHIYAPVIAGANVIGISIMEGDEALLRKISEMCRTVSPRPKIVILNFPHNPTTRTVEIGFFEEIVRLAKRFGFYVIHDFAYGLTTFDGYKAPSFLQVPGAKDVGVESLTMSKGYNMAGWRIGFVAGNADMVHLLSAIKGYYDYGIFQAIQIATVIALRHCEEDMRRQARVYEQRRDVLCEGLSRAGWEIEPPKATMFAWVKIPEPYRAMGSIEFAMQCLQKAEVAVAPGRGFGEDGEGYLRVALVENEQRLRQAVRQIRRAFPVDG
ncbi:MAG: aminotransferase class I/II-fold pyridoxal phosphate-dependent enzyme [Anaerolineae bacterium]